MVIIEASEGDCHSISKNMNSGLSRLEPGVGGSV